MLLCNAHTHTEETSAIIAIDEKLFSSLSVPISTGGDWRPITSPKVPKQCLKLDIFSHRMATIQCHFTSDTISSIESRRRRTRAAVQ